MSGPKRRPLIATSTAALLAAAIAITFPADALTDARLIDRELNATDIKLSTLADGQISYFDANRQLQRQPVNQFVQVRGLAAETTAVTSEPMLYLADGQRLTGRWLPAGREEHIRWSHPLLGEIEASLEDVRGVRLTAELPEPAAADQVVLSNGDALAGYLSRLSVTGATLALDGAGDVELPAERLAAVRLTTPDQPPQAGLHTLVLADGTRLYVRNLRVASDEASFEPALAGGSLQPVTLPLTDVRRIELTASGARLIELSELARRVISGGDVFGLAQPPRLDRSDLILHAPVRVAIDVPQGATRLSAQARLDLAGVPADRHDWAACQLTVETADGQPAWIGAFDARQPLARVTAPLQGGVLILDLDATLNGPILDRLRLSNAVILIQDEPVSPAN